MRTRTCNKQTKMTSKKQYPLYVGTDLFTTKGNFYAVYEKQKFVIDNAIKDFDGEMTIEIRKVGKICRIKIIGEPKIIDNKMMEALTKENNWRPESGCSTNWRVYFDYEILERY